MAKKPTFTYGQPITSWKDAADVLKEMARKPKKPNRLWDRLSDIERLLKERK